MRSRPVHPRHLLAIVLLLVAPVVAGCSADDEPTPEELRRDRVETRLTGTFPKAQAECILDGLDEPTLIALDRTTDLDPESDAMVAYSFLVRACVEDPSATAVTTTTPKPTTPTTTTTSAGDGASTTTEAPADPSGATTTSAAD